MTLKKHFCAVNYSFNVFPFQFTLIEAVKVMADELAYKAPPGKEERTSWFIFILLPLALRL